jgi:protein MpaA
MPPAPFDLWVVPDLNPDGTAAGTRENAHGVDLNRDFGSRSGPTEPEARFIARLIRRLRPQATIWFHQHENRVRAWHRSIPAGLRYARLAGMRFSAVRWPAGSATQWQNSRFARTTSFVVELPAGRLTRAQVDRQVRAILGLGE